MIAFVDIGYRLGAGRQQHQSDSTLPIMYVRLHDAHPKTRSGNPRGSIWERKEIADPLLDFLVGNLHEPHHEDRARSH